MNILKFIRWLNGYADVLITGDGASLFLSFLIKNRISIWDVKTYNKGLCVKIQSKDYLKLHKLRHEFKGEVSIRHKKCYGLPFKLNRLLKRKSLLAGLFVCSVMLYVLSGFIWNIEIVGNEKISKSEIEKAYTELGVRVGMPTEELNPYSLRDKFPLLIRDVSWCSFNLEGTLLTINITEIKETDKADKMHYSNIVAAKDGVITHIDIKSGNKTVKVGDVVKKGELLISGAPEISSQRFTYSSGEIIADTQREFNVTINKKETSENRTGKIESKKILNIFGFKFPFYLDTIHFNGSSEMSEKKLNLFGKNIPISYIKRDFFEVECISNDIDIASATENAKALVAKELKDSKILSVKSVEYKSTEQPDSYSFVFICKCSENISEINQINVAT